MSRATNNINSPYTSLTDGEKQIIFDSQVAKCNNSPYDYDLLEIYNSYNPYKDYIHGGDDTYE